MANNPLIPWVSIAAIELLTSMMIMGYAAHVQIGQLKYKSRLQPLKWWLLGGTVTLIIFNLPLLNVYIAMILGERPALWETALAVVANATGKLIFATLWLMVYTFRSYPDPK